MNETQFANGHGHTNGNGNGKVFDLVKAQDPLLAQVVPAARRKVCLTTKICEAARMFYCYLTDCSLLPGINSRKGVVKFSDGDLAARFKVSAKTIRNWKRALEAIGEVWLTEKWMKNSFPQTVYNITAIVGQASLPMNVDGDDGSLPEDEVFSSNRRRQRTVARVLVSGKFGCRLHGRSPCPICRRNRPPGVPATAPAEAVLQNAEENAPSGKILPPTTAIDCRPQRQMVAAHHGNLLPSPTANGCRPARQMVAVVDGNGLPSPTANGFRRPRQTVADNRKARVRDLSLCEVVGESPTPKKDALEDNNPDKAFADWCLQWRPDTYRHKVEKELGRIKVKLLTSPKDEFWLKRAEFLRQWLDGGKPAAKPARSPALVKSVAPKVAPMDPEKVKKLWAENKPAVARA